MNSDLVVVVPDGGIEQAMRGILSRPERVGIRPLRGVAYVKHKFDHKVFSEGHLLAAPFRRTHDHALVLLDLAWDGRPTDDAAELSRLVEARLQSAWGDAARCVVIDPELEVWVWSDSPHVATELGWPNSAALRAWLASQRLWRQGVAKPTDPKAAFERATRWARVVPSNAIFRSLAEKVSFERCRDGAFLSLLEILRAWFGSALRQESAVDPNASP